MKKFIPKVIINFGNKTANEQILCEGIILKRFFQVHPLLIGRHEALLG